MAFTGKATTDSWSTEIAREMGNVIGDISPTETPVLDAIGDAYNPATNVAVEWLNDKLAPLTIDVSETISASTGDLYVQGTNSRGEQLQVGGYLYNYVTKEMLRIATTNAITIGVARAQCGTSAATIEAGVAKLSWIGGGGIEGRDWYKDTSSTRDSDINYIETLMYDIAVTERKEAVQNYGITSELMYQVSRKMKEILRDLERKVLIGKTSGNTIGSDSAPSAMNGLRYFIASEYSTNVVSLGTWSRTVMDAFLKYAWDNGADDIDIVALGPTKKQQYDADIMAIQRASMDEDRVKQQIRVHESVWMPRPVRVVLSRALPPLDAAAISTARTRIRNLRGNYFQVKEIAPTGLMMKRMIYGQYTAEFHNPEGFVWNTEY